MKDGETVADNETFIAAQYLRNGVTSQYDNVLMIAQPMSEIAGTYACSVDNSISIISKQTITIEGDYRN